MAQNKKSEFKEKIQNLSELAKSISHPARISILKTIAQKQECICGEIVEVLPLAQSTVSQHLKELKEIGLIKGEVEGVKSCYCINWKKVEEFEKEINKLFQELYTFKNKDYCC
ncbi:MAG TPA: metalloregulator ArsR/SmtB family transcription factor [Leptospiraceae bacterium]|nr:metalloregulator ArsR/SmtB family transcription factor [Leptospiraceae bacterium]HMW07910.1 metalloregulator ArsR/SmtB family transcription factor [Leptospiraceae bacterium]HMX32064.1 metalloregulator ArsR/SmtB family transcription factor [Leptospiraceae bacterium]HMY31173.1 metalloregulator ArsR/SmtB family transcription factor [Leptospiraceae bacterium]HMZ65406.1 metalloregulator ArsR/SmtB family transcription factor [Leptospiraceae bacterium]